MTNAVNRKSLESLVRQAVNMVFARDAALIEMNNSEWALAHRLAVYLEDLLPGWNIDCEFNRQGERGDPKQLAEGTLVRPDIVVHHRGRLGLDHNLLAIEIKKQSDGSDHPKVQAYTAPPSGNRKFQYRYGLMVALRDDCKMTWFENGQEVG